MVYSSVQSQQMKNNGGAMVERPHVAVFAFPFGTHAAPLYTLTRWLAGAAPDAIFSFFSSRKSNAGSTLAQIPPSAASLKNLRSYDVPDGCPDDFVFSIEKPEEEIELFLKVTPGNFWKGMEEAVRDAGGASVTFVVSDSFLWFAGEIAGEMGVPWVPLWTAGSASLQSHLYTDVLRRTIGGGDQVAHNKADENLDFILGLSGRRVQDLPKGVVAGDLNSLFAELLLRMAKTLPEKAAALALNSFEGLEQGIDADFKAKFKTPLLVGPLSFLMSPTVQPPVFESEMAPSSNSKILAWLDRQAADSVAYISFGTFMSPPPAELAELVQGLEASGVPFLWSLKEKMWVHLPVGFSDRTRERGFVVPWAPQMEVLGHASVGVFITHCGWNSVTESITGGVPMICRPFLGDQRLNARAVSHVWQIGVGVDWGVFTKERVMGALIRVLKTEEGRKMKERVGDLKVLALSAVTTGGSSLNHLDSLVEMICGTGGCRPIA